MVSLWVSFSPIPLAMGCAVIYFLSFPKCCLKNNIKHSRTSHCRRLMLFTIPSNPTLLYQQLRLYYSLEGLGLTSITFLVIFLILFSPIRHFNDSWMVVESSLVPQTSQKMYNGVNVLVVLVS